eukprot:2963870-Ditylum_brightwellii.AAC.1
MGGQTTLFASAAITYSVKQQITVATSSTEAKFIQAVSTAKMAKYLRIILNKIGIKQQGPTTIYEDNATAIMMADYRMGQLW